MKEGDNIEDLVTFCSICNKTKHREIGVSGMSEVKHTEL